MSSASSVSTAPPVLPPVDQEHYRQPKKKHQQQQKQQQLHEPCPIQRILIFHRRLYERSFETTDANIPETNREKETTTTAAAATLGEDASIEELSESILYYHHQSDDDHPRRLQQKTTESTTKSTTSTATSSSSTSSDAMKDAVKFLGLCSALYSLPSVLDDDDDNVDNHDSSDNNYGHDTKERGDQTNSQMKQHEDHPEDEKEWYDEEEDDEDESAPPPAAAVGRKYDNNSKDATKAVYLNESMLVFIPLEDKTTQCTGSSNEDDPEILAVVQVKRLYPNIVVVNNDNEKNRGTNDTKTESTGGGAGGGHPTAIQSSIKRCHQLFMLLYGGGIRHRLRRQQQQQQQQQYEYEGMAKLYNLLRDVRKLRIELNRSSSTAHNTDHESISMIEHQINSKQHDIQQLRKTLPIQSVRRDLDLHYKDYLSEYAFRYSRNGGVGRCLVECTTGRPTTTFLSSAARDGERSTHASSGDHNNDFPSSSSPPSSYSLSLLKQNIRELIIGTSSPSALQPDQDMLSNGDDDDSSQYKHDLEIIGIACFNSSAEELVDFQMKDTELSSRSTITTLKKRSGSHNFDQGNQAGVDEDSLWSLLSYMTSYRTKMMNLITTNQIPSKGRRFPAIPGENVQKEKPLGLGKVAQLSLSSIGMGTGGSESHAAIRPGTPNIPPPAAVIKPSNETGGQQSRIFQDLQSQRGWFLPSPPSYMMPNDSKLGGSQSIRYGDVNGIDDIWAPRVAIPITRISNEGTKATIYDANMILFEYLQFSFLVFLNTQSIARKKKNEKNDSDSKQDTNELLLDIRRQVMKLEEGLSEAVLSSLEHNRTIDNSKIVEREMTLKGIDGGTRSISTLGLPGQLVIAVNRRDDTAVFSFDANKPMKQSIESNTMSAKGTNKILQFFKLGKGISPSMTSQRRRVQEAFGNGHNEDLNNRRYSSLEWSTLGMDCRHLLASRLPLDACLALDDVIDEVRGRAKRNYEICTSMQFGWILAIVRNELEFYICLDKSFVTVLDVQSAIATVVRTMETFFVTSSTRNET